MSAAGGRSDKDRPVWEDGRFRFKEMDGAVFAVASVEWMLRFFCWLVPKGSTVRFPSPGLRTKGAIGACGTFGASKPYTDEFVVENPPEWNKDPYGDSSGR
jgi:hypothetical protein